MIERKQLIIFVLIVTVIVTSYLILSSEAVKKTAERAGNLATAPLAVDLALLEKNYQLQTKVIVNNFEKMAETDEMSLKQVEQTKQQLLNLKVSEKFKDLHLDLVLAMDKMLDFLADKDEKNRTESLSLLKQAKEKYAWLN